jgi:putative transposase
MSAKQRKQMIEPELHEPSISRQCQLISLSRSSFYYAPVPISAEDLELMRLIDEQYLKTPTYGSRSMVRHFWRQGRKVNRKRIQRLMQIMGIEAVYPKPHTSRPHPQHRDLPLSAQRPERRSCQPGVGGRYHVRFHGPWVYVPCGSHGLAQPQDPLLACLQHPGSDFCNQALQEALEIYGKPEIFNTDQGSPVYQQRVHPDSQGPWDRYQHGRPGPLPGQHLR